ncbi:hypothetical protein BC828DRAFT_389670 [Blastocladiella britannica]|nr:hypothetical protein BC828DRAFT_389670 [Blastocladiella britannica]
MANSSSKRIAAANRAFLATLLRVMAAANVATIAWLFLWARYPTTGWVWVPYYLSMGSTLALYRAMHGVGNPTKSADGDVVVHADLYGQGLHTYMFDAFCVISAAQVLSLLFSAGWYLVLLIPGYATYRLVNLARGFFGRR